MNATHNIESVKFEGNNILIKIDGKEMIFDLNIISTKLKNANELEKEMFKISPSGYGIHWPLIDEDISVAALLKNRD